jgi:hypothetical protein
MVVQTSAKKHQLHIPYMGQPAPAPVRTSPPYQRGLGGCQKHLRQVYNSDKGAVYANHQRRLKGFINQKYPDKPLVKILRIVEDGTLLSYEELWEAFLAQETERVRKIPPRPFSHPHPTVSRKASVNSELRKRWIDFYDNGDKSVADIKYTLYLLRKGLDSDEIRRRLRSFSLDIENRKKGHLNDYLDRTIFRAKSYLQQS